MNFTKELKELADYTLANYGKDGKYSEQDLENAVLVFQEVFMSRLYCYHKNKLNLEQLCIIGEESGKSFRQYIKLFTGIDLYDMEYNDRPYI